MTHSPVSPAALLAVSLGGALGAVTRGGLGELFPDGRGFPWTTFAINLSGSFLLALLPIWVTAKRHHLVPLFLGPGVLGGYTTLSAYAEQGRALLADEFCRTQRLLTLAATPQQYQLQRWYLSEFQRQGRGDPPLAWGGTYQVDPSYRQSAS